HRRLRGPAHAHPRLPRQRHVRVRPLPGRPRLPRRQGGRRGGHPADRVARSRLRGVRRRGLSGGAAPPRVTCAAGVVHSASAPRGAAYKPAAHPGGGGAGESWRRDLNSQPPDYKSGALPIAPLQRGPGGSPRGFPRGRVHILTGPTAALLTTVCTVETRDVPGLITRPLARLGIRKSAMDRAVEPPLSPMAPVDLDDDAAVTDVLNLALEISSILLASGEAAADTVTQAESVAGAFGLPGATVEVTFTSLMIGVNRRRGRPPLSVIRVVDYRTVDMTRVTRVSRLIDQIVRRRLTVEQATAEVEEIVAAPHPHSFRVAVLGWAMLGCAIVIQLGGSPIAGILSMISTFGLMYTTRFLSVRGLPAFFQQVAGGFIAAGGALASFAVLSDAFIDITPSQLVAAGIIVLLAGLTLVGAIEDAITGFPVTSAGRGVETMIITGGILGGITLALELFDRLGTS